MSAPLEAKTETATNKDLRSEALREIESRTEAELDVKGASRITAIEKAPESLLALTHEERVQLEKRVVRKIDFTLLPILMVMYILNYLDRNNIGAAKLYGIQADLNLKGTEYQTCVSLLFATYILFQVPSNLIASRMRWPGIYVCGCMAAWGVISAATAACQSYGGLAGVRLVLGVTEAAFFPGAIYLLTCWYTKKELASRTAILYSGSQLGNAFGTLLARGILTLDGKHGIEGWRWLFIIEGVATVGLAAVFAVLLPNLPQNSWQLSKLEKAMAVFRLEMEAGDTEQNLGAWISFKMCVLDIKTWYFMGILSLTYVAGAVNSFFPSVVATLGYSSNNTLLLTAPPFIFCCICMMINGWHADRTRERFWHIAIPLAVTVLSQIIAISTLHTAARYVAMMLMPASFYSAAIVTLTWISQSMPRPASKRAAALAFINSFANTPNIWCSYLYQDSMKPRYVEAFSTNLAACVIAIVIAFLLRLYMAKENKKMDEHIEVKNVQPELQAIGWRYIL